MQKIIWVDLDEVLAELLDYYLQVKKLEGKCINNKNIVCVKSWEEILEKI